MTKEDYLTSQVLCEIYRDYDLKTSITELSEKYGMTETVIKQLVGPVRTPWIRMLDAASVSALTAYWNGRQILSTTAAELNTIQLNLNHVKRYSTYDDMIAHTSNINVGDVIWIDNISLDGTYMSDRLLGDIQVGDEEENQDENNTTRGDLHVAAGMTRGGLIQYYKAPSASVPSWRWLNTGPDKTTCVAHARNQNTYNGFLYVVRDQVADNTDITANAKYVSFLSMQNKKFNINLEECNWGLINKWPWEVEDWVDVTSGTDTELMRIVIDTNTSAKIAHFGGDVELSVDGELVGYITDINGNPIDESATYADTRKVTYNIRTLQLDYALTLANDPEYATYREDVTDLLRSYFSTIRIAKQSLLERTDLFYAPIRTMGYAEFKGTNGSIVAKPLDISMSFRLYVKDYVYTSIDNKETIKNAVLNIIDKHIDSGTISTARIAEDIRASLSDTVVLVENTGINGDSDQRVLILNEQHDECKPHLKQKLVVKDNGEVSVERDVTLEYVAIA